MVYLDYSAVTIVEKALLTYNRAAMQKSNITETIRANEDDGNVRESSAIQSVVPSALPETI